jgi:hypothetical protein
VELVRDWAGMDSAYDMVGTARRSAAAQVANGCWAGRRSDSVPISYLIVHGATEPFDGICKVALELVDNVACAHLMAH